jgi:hypothetical protein
LTIVKSRVEFELGNVHGAVRERHTNE